MSQTAKMVRGLKPKQNLIRAIKIYVNFARNPRNKDKRALLEASKKTDGIHDCICQIVIENEADESVKSELLRHYADFHDARNDRFDLIEQRLPLRVWMLLGVFSLAWLWGFFWLQFNSESLLVYITSCTIFSVTILFGYALDMNNPFAGFWRMNLSPFKDNKY